MDLPERVAIAFIGAAIVATAGLGGAVAFELGMSANSNNGTQSASAALPGTGGATPTPGATAAASSSGSTGSAGSAGTAGTQGSTVSSGGASGGSVAALSNQSIGVSHGVITVGGIYDESAVLDATVERDTVRAYFNQVNAAGGVNGYKFQLVDCDSAYDPTRGHQCSNQLLSQNVLAMVGPLSASSEQPEVPYLTSHGMPVIGGLGVPSEYGNPLSFPVSIDLARGATGQGLHAADLKTADGGRMQRPGIVLLNTNFTDQIKKYLLDALHSKGIKEADVITVDGTKADYTDTVIKLKVQDNADAIIAGLDPFSYARFFQAMQNQNYKVLFYGSGLDKASAAANYGTGSYTFAESLTPLIEPVGHESMPAVAEYLNAVKKYYPNQVSALDVYSEGDWVAAKVFVEAIRRIGSQPVTRRSLVDSLNGITNFETGLTKPITYTPNDHDPNRCLQWIRQRNGTWETYSGWNCF